MPPFYQTYYAEGPQRALRARAAVVSALWTRLGAAAAASAALASAGGGVRVVHVALLVRALAQGPAPAVSPAVGDVTVLLAAVGMLPDEDEEAATAEGGEGTSEAAVDAGDEDGSAAAAAADAGGAGDGEGDAPPPPPPAAPPAPRPLPCAADMACLHRRVDVEDLREMLCRVVAGRHWRYRLPPVAPAAPAAGPGEGTEGDGDAGSPAGESKGDPTPVAAAEGSDGQGAEEEGGIDAVAAAEASMSPAEVLASRLDRWLGSVDVGSIVLPKPLCRGSPPRPSWEGPTSPLIPLGAQRSRPVRVCGRSNLSNCAYVATYKKQNKT